MQPATRPPNTRLAWERLQRGWSHEELKKQLIRAMVAEGETDTGLSRNTVRRWESGERAPEPRYRKYLVMVFGKPADQLGLLEAEELALRPGADELTNTDSLWRFVSMLGGWSQNIDRETFLRGLLALGASPLLASLDAFQDGPPHTFSNRFTSEVGSTSGVSTQAVADFEAITAGYRRLYWTAAPWTLYASVCSHAELGAQLLGKGGTGPLIHRLATAVAESAMLAGRVAFFDLKKAPAAQGHYDLAFERDRDRRGPRDGRRGARAHQFPRRQRG